MRINRVILMLLAVFILGNVWGFLMDWLWPYTLWKLAPEALGAVYIGLAITLRTRRWWCKHESDTS